ncbi:MAG: Tfp pilus assembly protein PilW [Lysobacterales bacterium]
MNTRPAINASVRRCRAHTRARSTGFNLIELMIAMVLGLLVVGGAVSIFVTNQQTYRATESLGRIQENTRTAFEIMARELREAGGNPCGKNLPAPANVLNNATANWWSNFTGGLTGYDAGTALPTPLLPAAGVGSQIPGTDAFDIQSAAGTGISVVAHNPVAATFQVSDPNRPFRQGDILMVCDFRQAAIFQMSGPVGVNAQVNHNQGGAVAPGNCTQRLGLPVNCGPLGATHQFGANSTVARLAASRWYVGDTGRVNSSNGQQLSALFRSTPRAGVLAFEEIAEGVVNMQVTYMLPGAAAYVPANLIAPNRWTEVIAVNVTLTLSGRAEGETGVGSDGQALQRQVNYVVNLRNRTI